MTNQELSFLIIGVALGGLLALYAMHRQVENTIQHLQVRQKQLWLDMLEWRDRADRLAREVVAAERSGGHIHKLLLVKSREAIVRASEQKFLEQEREHDDQIFRL